MSSGVVPGRFKISNAMLTTVSGSVDISGLIGEVIVEESIYRYFPIYNISIVDGLNIFENYQLSGNESLSLTIDNIGQKNTPIKSTTKQLVVISYDAYYRHTRAQGYKMVCMDKAAWLAITMKISRSMNGTADEIVRKLCSEIGYSVVPPTASKGNHNVVFPNITYSAALEMMIRKCYASDNSTYHLFGTFWDKNYFYTYSDMISKGPIETYHQRFNQKGEVGTVENYEEERTSIKQMGTTLNLSNSNVSSAGGNTARFHAFDLSKKVYGITEFDIIADGGSLPKMKSMHMLDSLYGTGGPEAFSFVRTTNENAYQDKGDVFDIHQESPLMAMKKNAVLQNQGAIQHQMTVSGDHNIHSGVKLTVKLPRANQPEDDPSTDEWMSGDFLVTAVKHTFSDGYKYTMDISMQRDSR